LRDLRISPQTYGYINKCYSVSRGLIGVNLKKNVLRRLDGIK